MNESMPYTVPGSWEWTSLGEIAEIVRSQVDPQKEPNASFNYLSIENVESNSGNLVNFAPSTGQKIKSAKIAFTTRDILYSKLRPYLNKVHLPTFDGISATDLIPIRPIGEISREYVAYFLRTRFVVQYANQRMRGIQLPRIAVEDLLKLPVPLPPFAEQSRIVLKIESMTESIRAAKRALATVKPMIVRFRQSVLAKAFRGELTERNPNDAPADRLLHKIEREQHLTKRSKTEDLSPSVRTSSLEEIPDIWAWTTLGAIAYVEMGQSPPGDSYNQNGNGTPLLNGPTEFGVEHPNPVQWTTSPTKLCTKDDVLICVRGNTTGRINFADRSYCIGRGLAAIRPDASFVDRSLVYYFLLHKTNEIMSRTAGSTFPNLPGEQLRTLPFPLAPPWEQKAIVSKIQKTFNNSKIIEENVETALHQTDAMEQSILSHAFRGELIPQHNDDEPASVLLKRIRARSAILDTKGRSHTVLEMARPARIAAKT